jgi:hypothetical protein
MSKLALCALTSLFVVEKRGQKNHFGAVAKTGLAAFLIELNYQNLFYAIGTFLKPVTKSKVVLC